MEKKGDIDIDEFTKFSKYHHALLFPAFQMQSSLQRNILGVSYWNKHANRRIEISKGEYLSIHQFMALVSIILFYYP